MFLPWLQGEAQPVGNWLLLSGPMSHSDLQVHKKATAHCFQLPSLWQYAATATDYHVDDG